MLHITYKETQIKLRVKRTSAIVLNGNVINKFKTD